MGSIIFIAGLVVAAWLLGAAVMCGAHALFGVLNLRTVLASLTWPRDLFRTWPGDPS